MPKRIPTPPPGDDEPKYLSVVHPYARDGYCNMKLQQDRQDIARWVACCIEKDAFFAVFHKPSARDMVIIEVDRDYPHFDRILGEHRWSEFLRNPSDDEKERVTQVFYCTYYTGRMVQKNSWDRIDIKESWFASWSPSNSLIKYPYPAAHFCDVPVEDVTNHPLCSSLPTKPPVPEVMAAPKPAVGAARSVAKGSAGTTAGIESGATPKGASKPKGLPKMVTPPAANVKMIVTVPQATPPQVRGPGIGDSPFGVKALNVSGRTDTTPSTALAARPADGWNSSPSVSGRSTPACRTDSPTSHDGLAELDSIAPGSWGAPLTQAWLAADTVSTSGRNDVPEGADSYWKESQKDPEQQLYNVHGVICTKGICQECANQLRAEKKAEAEKERAAQKRDRGKRPTARGALGRGGPPTATNSQSNPFRGPGATVKTNWRGAPRMESLTITL